MSIVIKSVEKHHWKLTFDVYLIFCSKTHSGKIWWSTMQHFKVNWNRKTKTRQLNAISAVIGNDVNIIILNGRLITFTFLWVIQVILSNCHSCTFSVKSLFWSFFSFDKLVNVICTATQLKVRCTVLELLML